MKALQALRGKKAEASFDLPMPDGSTLPVLLRPITDLEDADSVQYATEFADKRGSKDAGPGDVQYEKGYRAHVLFTAVLDSDSSPDARERFFSSPDEITKSFHPEAILYLYERWQAHQDSVSPLLRAKSPEDFLQMARELTKGGDDSLRFFCRMSPLTRSSCMTFLARLALNSQQVRSSPISLSETPAAS